MYRNTLRIIHSCPYLYIIIFMLISEIITILVTKNTDHVCAFIMLRAFCSIRIFSTISTFKKCLVNHRRFSTKNKTLVYSGEVLEAKKNDTPIVALESTIITHGMPYPDNLETALRVEDVVRNQGAVPATIGVLDGKVCVGIDREGLARLSASERAKTVKCSRRDFPFVIANKLNGGTTVSGTILVANIANIPIMATGGIGGVHRFAELTFDVSADLTELGRTPIAVVCAGVKAILDIPKTLEFLETQGIPVVTVGDGDTFPAFYCRETVNKIQSPYRVASPKDAANLIKAHRELALAGGILFAVPIPQEYSLDPEEMETAIIKALRDAEQKNITGKDTTPFLLQRLTKITAGQSLRSNKALIENNVKVAAEIAVRFSIIKNAHDSSPNIETVPRSEKSGPVVIGGAILDTVVQLAEPTINFDGRTHPGKSRESCGGVGRNVAAALINLGVKETNLLSVVGDDNPGQILRQSLQGRDGMVEVRKDVNTARYVALLDFVGECKFGIGEMTAHEAISPDLVQKYRSQLEKAAILILDGNPPLATILEVLSIAAPAIPVWYEPTDVTKATKIFQSNEYWKNCLHFISPNQNELMAIAKYLKIDVPVNSENLVLETVMKIAAQVAQHVPVVLTTLGSQGLLVSRKADKIEPFYNGDRQLIHHDGAEVQTRLYPPISFSTDSQERIVSVSGCGDCLVAGVIRGIQEGLDEASCVRLALKAASVSLTSFDPVPASLSSIKMFKYSS
ncbi:pseudouridine-metabolizing bifunctional protein C1861.05 isoform X1 [Neodiprion virginianus]|uniref:pseudouridine-metabolizing bifunctional protein C1861.05 isoform X1 n=1 Tax=Neodiprion virginianus TaxID=2961670 RepID=UPI001EE69503|nr:pseudouridine-metabolizing bifunctional protein C1861.05 isoform X1 [Neodiprion virginianus]